MSKHTHTVDELLVYGYIHEAIENEFYFSDIILPNATYHMILSYFPKAHRLSIPVSLGPCIVSKHANKRYTIYTFTLGISNTEHVFSARYRSLRAFHEQLLEDEHVVHSFGHCIPPFPSKKPWKDFTQKHNYEKRAQKLLKYFQALVSNEATTKSDIFHNGIFLDEDLRQILLRSFRGYYWSQFPQTKTQTVRTSKSIISEPEQKTKLQDPKSISAAAHTNLYTFQDELNALLKSADSSFMDCCTMSDSERRYSWVPTNNEQEMYGFLRHLHIFCVEDALPPHRVSAEKVNSDQPLRSLSTLFQPVNKSDIKNIDDIASELVEAVLLSCQIE